MAESIGSRPPVAIRIVRPFQTEDEFLENELETVGKTSVILIGAHARPTGVILRFEVTLATGATILRGEGRVLAHKESAFRGQPGLSLRFTRLDPKSKALVDRAAAIREAKAAGDPAPMSVRLPPSPQQPAPSAPEPSAPASRPASVRPTTLSQPDAAIADALTAETPQPARASRPPRGRSSPPASNRPASLSLQPSAVLHRSEPPRAEDTEPPAAPHPEPRREASVDLPPAALASAASPSRTVERPDNRDDLLAKLRERAATLPRERVEQILSSRN